MSSRIVLSDPDLSQAELQAVQEVLQSDNFSYGEIGERFEEAFAARVERRDAVAVSSGGAGLRLVLEALGIGPGDEVVCSPHSWKETAHAIATTGATPVFAEIDYWSGTLDATRVEARITDRTRVVVASNTNGHPAPWGDLEQLAAKTGIVLVEDSTEAIGSRWKNRPVGSFGRASVFDFSHPSAIACGEGGMVATDDDFLASRLRHLRGRRPDERASVVVGTAPSFHAGMGEIHAALGLAQLKRLDGILLRRQHTERLYQKHIRSFEGIKDPYLSPEATEVHWMLYVVHLGKRFTRQSRDAIVDDLRASGIEAAPYSVPLHTQRAYVDQGWHRGDFPTTERIADRAVALPLHRNISDEQIAFIVSTMKDASVNVGAGAAIY